MKKVEILSPVGSYEAFLAAREALPDAIYLAGKMYGARSFANNFSENELIEVIKEAHLYGIKVYVTCNILLFEREVANFLKYVEFLYQNNVDALIMQDLGMIDLVHKTFPDLEIHASTQMHIHNLEGAKMIEKLGVKRVVLARETNLDLVKKIKAETNLEVEVFVHGALCASYSGMCLFARSIGLRSGNRGTCSGCCRLPYDLIDNKGNILNDLKYPLSMKDLMTLDYLDKIIDAGVDSLKIEGRMKSPSYVYLVTKLYKEARDNYLKNQKVKYSEKDFYKLKTVFNREYTKGFILNEEGNITNPKTPNHQGVLIGEVIASDTKKIKIKLVGDVSIHDGLRIVAPNFTYGLVLNKFSINNNQVYKALENDIITLDVNTSIPLKSKVLKTSSFEIDEEIKNKIKNKEMKIPIKMQIEILKNQKIKLKVTDFENEIEVLGFVPSESINKPITKEIVKEKLEKTGNTIYKIEDLEISLADNLFIPISNLNNLKREALEKLNEVRINKFKKKFRKANYQIDVPDYETKNCYTILTNKEIDTSKYSYIYTEDLKMATKLNYILKLPKVVSSYDNFDINQEYLVGELGALENLHNIVSDYSFNVTNSYTVALLHSLGVKRVTLSLELSFEDIKDLVEAYHKRYQKRPNLEVIIKTRMELMVLKFKLNDYYKNPIYLRDRFKNNYIIKEKNGLTYIYDYKETKRENSLKYFKNGINYLREEDIN